MLYDAAINNMYMARLYSLFRDFLPMSCISPLSKTLIHEEHYDSIYGQTEGGYIAVKKDEVLLTWLYKCRSSSNKRIV